MSYSQPHYLGGNSSKRKTKPPAGIIAAPLSKSENPALFNAVGQAKELASMHMFLDQGKTGLINDDDPGVYLHQNGGPSQMLPGDAGTAMPLHRKPYGATEIEGMTPPERMEMQRLYNNMRYTHSHELTTKVMGWN